MADSSSQPASMQGKTVLITGATQGIGKETARELARLGANVVLVVRDRGRGEAVVSELQADTNNPSIELLVGDLSSLADIRRFAGEFLATHEHLHVLINNASTTPSPRYTRTDEGIEASLTVNHLAPFLLTNLLLDRLKLSAPARIVNVSSAAHRSARPGDFADLNSEKGYNWQRRYAIEKLAVILFTYELARRLFGTGVSVNALHPGVVNTGMSGQFMGQIAPPLQLLGRFLLTPQQGAATSIYLASSAAIEGVTGKYFIKSKETRSSKASYDLALAQQLWEASEQLTGLDVGKNASSDATSA